MERPEDRSKAVAEDVADVLRDRIVKGDLEDGTRLVERRLSVELNVSRTPVREALKLLEADGLVEISLHRGALVAPFRSEDATRLFDVIAALEGLAARRLAAQVSRQVLQELEDLHQEMLAHHRAGRRADYFDVNTRIHDTIIESCGNPIVIETHRRLIARTRRGRFLAISDPDRLNQAVAEHETLMTALKKGDSDAAGRIWEQHLRHTGETLADVLRKRELS